MLETVSTLMLSVWLLQAAAADDLVDITSVKEKLVIVGDGKGHYVAVIPFGEFSDHFYYGDGKDFWLQRVYGGGSSGEESFDRSYWDPRYRGELRFRDKRYTVHCDQRTTELTLLPPEEAKAMMEKAKFHATRWKTRAYALARDDRGVYYFVDKQREPETSRRFRLFVGPRGAMKELKMVNVVSDSAGDIFATKKGELRLVLNQNDYRWIAGKKQVKLVPLPVEANAQLIYSELGVYEGQRLGTPCDDL
jgi:hypothetical protein